MRTFLFDEAVQIPTTLAVISECWMLAENDLQDEIRRNYPGADEETITLLFHGKFADRVRNASEQGHIEYAFLEDLVRSFPDVQHLELSQIANGLIADVSWHKRTAEKNTGGDLGLMIIRPSVERNDYLIKIGDYRRGILCQAKLKNAKGKWGQFTKKQQQVLSQSLDYLCLLLYNYADTDRRHLHNFQWYIRREEALEQLSEYLRENTFPSLVESDCLIQAVGQGVIGTDNDDILDKFISPVRNPCLTIRISWPEGRGPGPFVSVASYIKQTEDQSVTQYRGQLLN